MPLLPGEQLQNRYRIVNLLASGSYGAVYRGWDTVDQIDVALKEYLDPSVETQKQFRAEARQLAALDHPQLPDVLDHFSLEGVGQYLVFRFVDGVDLQSLVNQYGSLPTDLIVSWLQAACVPLTYLHEQGRLHLDIKPANIRIAPDGEVFLVDTGLAGLGVRPQEPGYGSPEQQAQGEVGVTSDIYSLGATLYTLLTGEVPPNALGRESGLEDLIPAREVNPDIAPHLSIVAGRAMSLRSDTRFETAEVFSRALVKPVGQVVQEETPRRSSDAGMGAAMLPEATTTTGGRTMPRRSRVALSVLGLMGIALVAYFIIVGVPGQEDVTGPEATATLQSAVIAALTELAPTVTPVPEATTPPTPTPQPLITGTGSRMVYIPGGIFRIGDEESEEPDEKPAQIVRLDPYYVDETEVTNGDYAQCLEAGACTSPVRLAATYYENYFGNLTYDNYPVINVTWFQAEEFCSWRGARLPSEAEWEMAAAVDNEQGLKFDYPWGDTFDGTRLNFCDVNCPRADRNPEVDDGFRDTSPVASYPDGRSPLGVYDMLGNVVEWVSDWYDPRIYRDMSDTNPRGPLEGEFKSVRGGSWLSPAEDVYNVARSSFDPRVAQANLGFRCASPAP